MKDGKIQGIGVIVAIIFTFIMLTVGRVPTVEEQELAKEQKEEQALREERVERRKEENYKYKTILEVVSTEDGINLRSISDQKEWFGSSEGFELEETPLRDGDILNLVFLIVEDMREDVYDKASYKKITQEQFNNIEFKFVEFKTSRSEVTLVEPKDIEFDEEKSEVSVNVKVKFEDYMSYVYPEKGMGFEMITSNDKNIVKVGNDRYFF